MGAELCKEEYENISPEKMRELKEEQSTSTTLNQKLSVGKDKDVQVIKMLLLGAGQSGKSTLFKQMIQIYGSGFTQEDKKLYKGVINENVIYSIQTLCFNAPTYGPSDEKLNDVKSAIMELKLTDSINENIAKQIGLLWEDSGIQKTYASRSSFQLLDSTKYFMEKTQ